MNAKDFDAQILIPALTYIRRNLPGIPASTSEHFMLLAIAGQEGAWKYRTQQPVAYAHSFWQFERGGIRALMLDDVTNAKARAICMVENITFSSVEIWKAMALEAHDGFSAAMARLLLWSDAHALPDPEDDDATFDYYKRNWRPGKPDDIRWGDMAAAARGVVMPSTAAIATG